MKKGKIAGVLALALSASMLTGCVDNMPDMTEEQTELVAEYAASLLLKYSSNYNYRIADETEVEALAASIEEETSEAETTTEETEEASSQEESTQEKLVGDSESVQASATVESEEETETIDVSVEMASVDDVDIAAELGLEGFTLTYASSEITDSYPKAEVGSGFSVAAPQGKKLLILHFTVENTTNEAQECNIFDAISKVRVRTNDSGYKEALSTLLTNDFTTYMEEIGGGESRDVVVALAVNEQDADELESIVMRLTTADDTTLEFQVE